MYIDSVDFQIISLLKENSRLTYKEIGDKIHLTGQAVGARITKLVEEGYIEKFTIALNNEKLGVSLTAFIKIYMKTLDHNKMKRLIKNTESITQAYRISGDCCYLIKVETSTNEILNNILDEINEFATYQLSLSISKLK